jgi:hypothetical protein
LHLGRSRSGGTDVVLLSGSAAPAAPGLVAPGSLEAPTVGTGALAVISAIVLWQVYTGMDFQVDFRVTVPPAGISLQRSLDAGDFIAGKSR